MGSVDGEAYGGYVGVRNSDDHVPTGLYWS